MSRLSDERGVVEGEGTGDSRKRLMLALAGELDLMGGATEGGLVLKGTDGEEEVGARALVVAMD